MPRALLSLVITTAVLALLVGCSNNDPATPDPTTTASTDPRPGLAALYAGDDAEPADLRDGRCFAEALVGSGFDLEAAGLVDEGGEVPTTAPPFDEATAQAWVDAQLGCVSYLDAATRAVLVQSKGAVDAASFRACLADGLTEEQARTALVDALLGDFSSVAVNRFSTTQADCATASR